MKAIVYTSNAGHTKAYAELLGKETGLPVYECSQAAKKLPQGSEVIYLGWLMAGVVKGYKKAAKRFAVKAICAVGMAANGSQLEDVRKANNIPNTPLFSLQGGFEIEKLHGIYKFMMSTMKATIGKSISQKENRTEEENDMLELLINGGDRVSKDGLAEVLAWYEGVK